MSNLHLLSIFLLIESAAFLFALLIYIINDISETHPTGFKALEAKVQAVNPNSFWNKLKADFAHIYKATQPELYISPDGNTLYLSTKVSADWKPEQVILYMLGQKSEFIEQLKAKDPIVFDAFNSLLGKLVLAKIQVQYAKMNYLPTFKKDVIVWKLPLLDLPVTQGEINAVQDIVVKELQLA